MGDVREERALQRHRSTAVPPYHPDWLVLRELNRDVRWALAEYAQGALLDVGCGGRPYEHLPSHVQRWIGLDRAENAAADVHGSATDIPLAENAVQTVLCTQVLEHLADPVKAVTEMHRVLEPGGILILSAPQYWPLHEEPYDFFRYTKIGLQSILERCGFDAIARRVQGKGAVVAGQALSNAILCAGDTFPISKSFAFKASKAPLYLIVNACSLFLGLFLRTERDVLNHLFIARKR